MSDLIRRIMSKMLPTDKLMLEKYAPLYIQRTHAGRNQLGAGAWSSTIRSGQDPIFEVGVYGPATDLARHKLVVLTSDSFACREKIADGVSECRKCPCNRKTWCIHDDGDSCHLNMWKGKQ